MTGDVRDYKMLSDAEKNAYDKALSQLIFMDSLQTNNLIDNVNPYVTSPEINLILVRQSFEEALHSQSYAVMVDSISTNSAEIYELWRRDMMLKNKNDSIAKVYEDLAAFLLFSFISLRQSSYISSVFVEILSTITA